MQTSLSAWIRKAVVPPAQPTTATTSHDPPPLTDTTQEGSEGPIKGQSASAATPQSGDGIGSDDTIFDHPNISLVQPTTALLTEFKRINALLLPIPYTKSFYDEIISDPVTASITVLACWTDHPTTEAITRQLKSSDGNRAPSKGKVIGGIRCRLLSPNALSDDAHPTSLQKAYEGARSGPGSAGDAPLLYISTLTLLSPYRSLGVATALLERVEKVARETYGAKRVGAHVWEANEVGMEWYKKRGFRVMQRREGYYLKLKPQGAFVIVKEL